MSFRPLSQRRNPTPEFDAPKEGIPPYLRGPIRDWLIAVISPGGLASNSLLDSVEIGLQIERPLQRGQFRLQDLLDRVDANPDFALDVLDVLLHTYGGYEGAARLADLLTRGGSVWEVADLPEGGGELRRRAFGPIGESLDELASHTPRVHDHMGFAWSKLMGRSPDPSSAYREAIRAVEVAAKPVVAPNDARFTLGKAIRLLTDTPDKWSFVLEGADAASVAAMAQIVWKGQLDRHGTDDESVPLLVTQEQADAAFHICLALCRIFAGGLIQRIE